MRIFYLFKKELIEIFRQREMLVLIFIAPILQTIVLGYVVTTDVKNIPVQVVNLSDSSHAYRIVNRINHLELFDVKKISYSPEDAVSVFQKGTVKAVIVLRDGFEHGTQTFRYPEVQVLMDGMDANTAGIAAGYFNGIARNYVLSDARKRGFRFPLKNKTVIRFNPNLQSINYMGPGIVALLLTIISMFFTSISIVREKEQQTMDTLLISRLTPIEIYSGKALPLALLGLIEMGIGVVVVVLVFGISIRGSLIYLFIAAVIFLFAILSYALLISTLCTSQQQALFFSWFSMVIFLLLSGLFTPVENIPSAFRWLADINPLRYLIRIIRQVFLKGNDITYFANDLLIMLGITVVILSLSLFNFKRLVSK
ncbi:MAG: ABC transporter permease subunit [Candidatus Aminicenantes bacterium]|nr:ABC transporter permease subunit [Candidatus Aminicenantes bacterium]